MITPKINYQWLGLLPACDLKTFILYSSRSNSFSRNDSLLSNGSCDDDCRYKDDFPNGVKCHAKRRGTSFASTASSEVFGRSRSSFASFSDFISNVSGDSRTPSLDSLSVHDLSIDQDSAFTNDPPEECCFTSSENPLRERSSSLVMLGRKAKTASGIWKKLPFYNKKVHPSASVSDLRDENYNAVNPKSSSKDLKKTNEILEKLREENNSLKIMVNCWQK